MKDKKKMTLTASLVIMYAFVTLVGLAIISIATSQMLDYKNDYIQYQQMVTDPQMQQLLMSRVEKIQGFNVVCNIFCFIWLIIAVGVPFVIGKRITVIIKNLERSMECMAEGNLDVNMDFITTTREMTQLKASFLKMHDQLKTMIEEIRYVTKEVSEGAEQISGASNMLAVGATEQASAVEQINGRMEEITVHTGDNQVAIEKIQHLSNSMKDKANAGNVQMQDTLKAMDAINNSAKDISRINKTIEEIAFQTNILALNAAVEAARAGQHGLGFAVVADEIRKLAAKSASAAKETAEMIDLALRIVGEGTLLLEGMADIFEHIYKSTEKENTLIENMVIAMRNEKRNIEEINTRVEQVTEVIQSNSATSEETAAASLELAKEAERLDELLKKFRLRIS